MLCLLIYIHTPFPPYISHPSFPYIYQTESLYILTCSYLEIVTSNILPQSHVHWVTVRLSWERHPHCNRTWAEPRPRTLHWVGIKTYRHKIRTKTRPLLLTQGLMPRLTVKSITISMQGPQAGLEEQNLLLGNPICIIGGLLPMDAMAGAAPCSNANCKKPQAWQCICTSDLCTGTSLWSSWGIETKSSRAVKLSQRVVTWWWST